MTTLHVSDTVNERVESIRDDGGHSSKDSAIRELIHAYDRLEQLNTDTHVPTDTDVGLAFNELGLHHSRPLPDAGITPEVRESWDQVCTIYPAGPWLLNERLSKHPPAVSVAYSDDSFVIQYRATPHRYIDSESGEDVTPPGTYHFVVAAENYENELLNIIRRSKVHQFLAPEGGVPTEFQTDGRLHPTFGGWGRTVTTEEATDIFDLETVTDNSINHGEWGVQEPESDDVQLPSMNADETVDANLDELPLDDQPHLTTQ